jgi:tryptophan 2,3-dioxygenase
MGSECTITSTWEMRKLCEKLVPVRKGLDFWRERLILKWIARNSPPSTAEGNNSGAIPPLLHIPLWLIA